MFGDSPVDYETPKETRARLERYAAERALIPMATMQRVSENLRREADEIQKYAPAESMLMHSIARRLELKLSKMK